MKSLEEFGAEEAENKATKTVSAKSDGFVIQSIELKGFMRYTDKTVIKFPEKLTVIVGRTGSGKTTILDAITFALYKRSSRTDVGVELDNVCARNGYVKLFFSQAGNNYELERGIKHDGKSYVNLKFNGKALHGSISELDARIRDIIGLDYVGFRNSTFIRQDEMKQLGAEIGSERLAIFQKLFRLELFEKALETAKKKLELIRSKRDILKVEIDSKKERLEKIQELEKELSDKEIVIVSLKDELTLFDRKIADKEKEKAELSKVHDEYVGTTREINYANKELETNKLKLEELMRKEKEVSNLKSELKKLEAETSDYNELKKKGEALKELEAAAKSIQSEKKLLEDQYVRLEADYKTSVKELSNKLEYQRKRLSSLSTDIDRDKAFSLLRADGALTERISRIKKELTWDLARSIISELQLEMKNTVSELDKISVDVKRINADSFALSEIAWNIDEIKNNIENERKKFESRLNEQKSKIAEKEAQLTSVGFDEEKKKELLELRQIIPKKEQTLEALESKKSELEKAGDVSKIIEELKARRSEFEKSVSELNSKLKELAPFEKKYSVIENELKDMRNKNTQIVSMKSGAEAELGRIKSDIEELKKLKHEIEFKEKELDELNEHVELLTVLKEEIFHGKGIVMYAINQLLPALAIKTARNLADMTDNRFSQAKIQTYEETYGHGIRIEVCGVDNVWHDIKEFSGGEKTQINAALRFAIAEELASLPQVGRTYGRMKTLFIDEGDLGALDTEISRELFVRKLLDIARFFDRIILITHLTDVADKFPARLHVSMSPEGISGIEVQR